MTRTVDIHVISIFPEMFKAITEYGVIARAIKQGVLRLCLYDPRDYTEDRHSTVDGRPYGGGPGMVMRPDVMTVVMQDVLQKAEHKPTVVFLSPQGKRFDHQAGADVATRLKDESLVLIAGRYEGIDERFIERFVDQEWSIGDYVLSGGELPAMVVIDAVTRLLPNTLGNEESAEQDSFVDGLLDCPHYTRPEQYENEMVPQVLLSGDHKAIKRWRLKQALGRTWLRRPDLLEQRELTVEESQLLEEFKLEAKV